MMDQHTHTHMRQAWHTLPNRKWPWATTVRSQRTSHFTYAILPALFHTPLTYSIYVCVSVCMCMYTYKYASVHRCGYWSILNPNWLNYSCDKINYRKMRSSNGCNWWRGCCNCCSCCLFILFLLLCSSSGATAAHRKIHSPNIFAVIKSNFHVTRHKFPM